jgi:hypothetical protein
MRRSFIAVATIGIGVASAGCTYYKMVLPDGREVVSSHRDYLEKRALLYLASRDLRCKEDDLQLLRYGRKPWQVSGCGRGAHYQCTYSDGPRESEISFDCSRLD